MKAIFEVRTFRTVPGPWPHVCGQAVDPFAREVIDRGFTLKHAEWPGGEHFWIAHTVLEVGKASINLLLLPGAPNTSRVASVNLMVPDSLLGSMKTTSLAECRTLKLVAPGNGEGYFYNGCYQRGLSLCVSPEFHGLQLLDDVWSQFEDHAGRFLVAVFKLSALKRAKTEMARRNFAGANRILEEFANDMRGNMFKPLSLD